MILESLLHESHSLAFLLCASFIAGILASFTPCIYPMLPITVGIITAQQASSMLVNFFLSLSYGIGIATVYATLGYVSVKTNLMFGQWLGNPFFIGGMVVFFLYLAFSMFGFYEMYTPQFLQARSGSTHKGSSFTYSFICGVITGAAASPCLTPALALLLGFAAKQNNPLTGFAVLFSFAMGLSVLLIVLGTFSSAISFLPRAGSWMNEVKTVFGFMLLGVCVTFLQPLITKPSLLFFLYGAVAAIALVYYAGMAITKKRNSAISLLLMLITGIATITLFTESYYQEKGKSLFDETETTESQ